MGKEKVKSKEERIKILSLETERIKELGAWYYKG